MWTPRRHMDGCPAPPRQRKQTIMSDSSVDHRRLAQAPMGLVGLILVAVGCGSPLDSTSSAAASASPSSLATQNPEPADDDNGGGNGGLVWLTLPTGPDIPGYQEIQMYKVLAAADASSCAALFSPEGVQVGDFVASFGAAAIEPNFDTGDRTRHLYEAGAHLCAGNEAAAREAFAAGLSLGDWDVLHADDAGTQRVVCTVWNAVANLLDPSAGPCTLTTADDGEADDGGADATDGASDDAADATDGASDDAADATDGASDAP